MDASFFSRLFEKIKALAISRKFWGAVGASIVIVVSDIEVALVVERLIQVWMVYIGSVAVEDGLSRYA
ncbi:MAG: hypothetical protein KAJ73_08920 [Zetaproteobacteria bacterium]|nr:hypothetical protein [Zetaproteobacteria bacterium]